MAFTVQDYFDLVRLLAEHPEWRAELRRLVLSDEVLTLPDTIRELAEAQRRTEQQIEILARHMDELTQRVDALAEAQRHTEQRVEELAEAQRRTEQRLEALTQQVDALAQAQRHLEQRLEALVQQVEALTTEVQRLTNNVANLTSFVERLSNRLDRLVGDILELRYREHAGGYFGTWVRGARAITPVELEDTLQESLTRDEVLDVLRLDLLVRGRWRALPEAPEVWLAVEVSSVVDEGDVARAWRRAHLLRRAGYRAIPVVAGERIVPDAEASARAQTVGVIQDGQVILGDEELATWLRD
jgi:uncharacterized protein YoxC